MSSRLDARLRASVAELYGGRCAYCDTELRESDGDIDFHQPLARGGVESADNAVYCCRRCNIYKGSYWHEVDAPQVRLLHPRCDDLAQHVHEDQQGVLVGDTAEGRFYIERLRLNRPPLLDLRRLRRLVTRAREVERELGFMIEAAGARDTP